MANTVDQTTQKAKKYLSWGFIPIPIRPITSYASDIPLASRKAPYGVGWNKTTKKDALARIDMALYKNMYKPMNVGILCGKESGVVVLDIDAKGGGMEAWKEITKDRPKIETFTVQTGGGGLHLYFKYIPLRTVRGVRYHGKTLPFDVRSDSGQVLGPGSIHPETHKVYEIIDGYDDKDDKPILSDVPTWLLQTLDFSVSL
jgi:hypothetical protein